MNCKDEIVKSIKTLSEMLSDRGVLHIEKLENFSDAEINEYVNNLPIFNIDLEDCNIRIIYNINNKFKFNEIKKMFDKEFGLYIIVSKDKMNANEVRKCDELGIDYQCFELRDLQFNISKHIYVPKHELITDDNVINQIVVNYQLKSKTQLPLILKTDPMAKYLHAKPGNIVKITRYSPTSGEHIVYRCCA